MPLVAPPTVGPTHSEGNSAITKHLTSYMGGAEGGRGLTEGEGLKEGEGLEEGGGACCHSYRHLVSACTHGNVQTRLYSACGLQVTTL